MKFLCWASLIMLFMSCGGQSKEQLDGCDPNPCDQPHQGVCVADGKSYECKCDTGYSWDGNACVKESSDPCDPNPCDQPHQGVCAADGKSYECKCDTGYSWDGNACVKESSDPCDPNPCDDVEGHRTRCMWDGQGGFECWCDTDYHDDQGLCCPAYSHTDDSTCVCNTYWVDPDGSGRCIPQCTDSTAEGLNGWCPTGQICVQGQCMQDACYQVSCPEHSACVVHDGQGVCQCDDTYHMSNGMCCLENSSNTDGLCRCDAGYVPAQDGSCEPDQSNPCNADPCSDAGLHQHICIVDDSTQGYHCDCDVGYLPNDQDQCTLDIWETCPGELVCVSGYCVRSDSSDEQCLTDDDCHEFNPQAPTTCNASAAGGICLGCTENIDCPGNAQCNEYGTCANICDDDNDCPYGKCYPAVGYCGQKYCYSDEDCFGGTVCLDEDGDARGMCKRIPCQ